MFLLWRVFEMSVVIEKELVSADDVSMGFRSERSFMLTQRAAKLLASSSLVPKEFQNNIANCVVALNMANRMGADPLMTMQNLYIVHGRPSWSSQFLIATFNTCGRFSALRYRWTGQAGTDTHGCVAYAIELSTGELLEGSEITVGMAKREGWYGKTGSKWQSMPEQMLRYRAAGWFIRAYAPELAMGLHTSEEVADTVEGEVVTNTAAPRRVGNLTKAAPILPSEQQVEEPVEV
jgi:hypothetical protein